MSSRSNQQQFAWHDGDGDDPVADPDWIQRLTACAGKTVYVVDSHSLIFQVFHALPEMTSPTGQPVGAVYGFVRDVFYLIEQKRPDYLVCAFDLPGPTFRHAMYDDYKVDRQEMPVGLRPQIPEICRLLAALRVPIVSFPAHEADDCLATIARQVREAGGTCVLVTGDKDCRQLVHDRVSIYNIRKNQLLDAEGVAADWGIRPDQVVDYQALVGDPVDNVPGVPLIGPKIASQLLSEFGSLEGIYAHLDQVKGNKRRENLQLYQPQALVSRELARLRDDLPLAPTWLDYRSGQYDVPAALELFREYGFRALSQKFAIAEAPRGTDDQRRAYRLIATPEELRELCEQLQAQPRFAVDTETTDLRPRWAQLVGLSFSWQAGTGYYVPVQSPADQPHLPLEWVLDQLRGVLGSRQHGKIGQNLKYDWIALANHGIQLDGIEFDTMVASYLLDAGQRSHSLDELSKRYLKQTPIPITDLIGTGKTQRRMSEVDVQKVCEYAAEDADLSWRLYEVLQPKLSEQGLQRLFHDIEMPLVAILAEMEATGIAVDPRQLVELSREFQAHMDQLEATIYQLAGRPFNIGSPRQLAEILFQHLKLPVLKRTKTGPSTDAEVLEDLAGLHPLPAAILDHRQYAKLKSTYADALPQMIHPQTQRIHTSFNQVVAATGRLSSNDPNLQNIPVRTEAGRKIRAAFHAAPDGYWLLAADYSQIELRVLAHFSLDEALLAAFAEDSDIHAAVASEVYQLPIDQVTSAMRRSAKAVNFGVIYGQSPFGLSKALGISQEAAAAFIDAYFARYPGVTKFIENLLVNCHETGYVSSIFGRRREIRGVRPPSERLSSRQRTLPERTAINTVIQGSAADLIKQAMIQVRRRLERDVVPARMLLQIHDELVFETAADAIDALATVTLEEMSSVAQLAVPLKVDVRAGRDWAHCETWRPA